MKKTVQILQRLLINDVWFISVPRSFLLLFWGLFILFKPAAALELSAYLTIPAGCIIALLLFEKTAPRFRPAFFLIPVIFIMMLIFLPQHDISGISAVMIPVIAVVIRSWKNKNLLSRCVAVCAAFFILVLSVKMFSGDWFDFYTSAAIALFAAAAWESGNIKNCR